MKLDPRNDDAYGEHKVSTRSRRDLREIYFPHSIMLTSRGAVVSAGARLKNV